MRSYFKGSAIAILICAALFSGCAATMLVGGTLENTIVITVDETSFSAGAKRNLARAKTLGVVSIDRASIKAADVFETRGGYLVTIDRVSAKQGEMTGSERREALSNLCRDKRVDVALLGRVLKTETGNIIGTMFTGRMKTTLNWTMDMLACGTSTAESFGGTLSLDAGVYNANQAKLEEDIGAEMGVKILAAIGGRQKSETKADASTQSATPKRDVDDSSKNAGDVSRNSSAARLQQPIMSNQAIQQRLTELGYSIGEADGIMGAKTVDALKQFQRVNGLATSGQANSETVEKLMRR